MDGKVVKYIKETGFFVLALIPESTKCFKTN